jgi:hypothetical protein
MYMVHITFFFLLQILPKEETWSTYLGSVAHLHDHILFFIAKIALKSSSSFHFNQQMFLVFSAMPTP